MSHFNGGKEFMYIEKANTHNHTEIAEPENVFDIYTIKTVSFYYSGVWAVVSIQVSKRSQQK